ncbi:MAG: FAD-binding oxidoreductase [Rhodospirillaceae bacterium]|nr:FAD-binding oxidoreductase [Rhodospirillaceae bacterium]MBT4043746.1 FAD-binding oxidoreductase [Rhodospirillaceae bacterium]MBT4689275.1 FAD-binding oxidoreductase [Rhodospirillaceae bacterium]MBT5079348.1 FAD-binding oxidoreductase [Rhodospirillaceae bacterium]MBT5525824.1 FAD-binding oxidoreductase [Rhodospirillaceae bacterium]
MSQTSYTKSDQTKSVANLTLPPSLWAATATPAPETPMLAGEGRADVAIIGGGFTGLSAALHLATANEGGTDVAVLEAAEPGWGASGRNGGQVIPGLKEDPRQILSRFGEKDGEAMVRASGAAADLVFDLIKRFEIDCDGQQTGWIQAAHMPHMLGDLQKRHGDWAARDANVAWLEADELSRRMGDDRYHGGWIDKRGGGLQPLSYARGLARAAIENGARIYGASPVTDLSRDGQNWRVTTAHGALRADKVIIATNGYTDGLWPGLAQTVVPVFSVQVATAPLGENMRGRILGGGEVLSDTHRVLWYFRQDAHGRLIMGGGGSAYESGAVNIYDGLRQRIHNLLPDAGEIDFEFAWNGKVALTTDHYPHLHELAPGLWAGLGFNGRGVAMATMMGKILADKALGTSQPEFDFPNMKPRPLPLHFLRGLAVTATRTYYNFRDALDDK